MSLVSLCSLQLGLLISMKQLTKSVVFLGPPPEFSFLSHYRQTTPLLVIKSNSALTVTVLSSSRAGVECFEDTFRFGCVWFSIRSLVLHTQYHQLAKS